MTEASVIVVFDGDEKVLVLRRSASDPWKPFHWNFPGGKVDYGEGIAAAASRELQEETGICIGKRSLSYRFTLQPAPDFAVHVFAVYLHKRPAVSLVDGEHDRYKWVDPIYLPEPGIPNFKKVALQVLAMTVKLRDNNSPEVRHMSQNTSVYRIGPKAIPYPYELTRPNWPVPNASAINWPQAQFAPAYLPPGSLSFQPYRYAHPKTLTYSNGRAIYPTFGARRNPLWREEGTYAERSSGIYPTFAAQLDTAASAVYLFELKVATEKRDAYYAKAAPYLRSGNTMTRFHGSQIRDAAKKAFSATIVRIKEEARSKMTNILNARNADELATLQATEQEILDQKKRQEAHQANLEGREQTTSQWESQVSVLQADAEADAEEAEAKRKKLMLSLGGVGVVAVLLVGLVMLRK